MLACIPTNDDRGLDAALCDHFGSAPCFTLYDTESQQVRVVPNGNSEHSHGTCHPISALAGYGIGAVVCRGMGRRAIDTMNAQGIRVYRTRAQTVRDVAAEVAGGELREISPKEACVGHSGRRMRAGDDPQAGGFGPGHGGGCGQDHGRGTGRGRGSGGGGFGRE